MVDVNYIAVLVAGAASMAVGFVWYGPLFGKPWMKLMELTEKSMAAMKKDMAKTYSMSMVGSVVMAYVLAVFANSMGVVTVAEGVGIAFWAWLGFVAPVQMTEALFGGKAWGLYVVNTGYQLASLLVMGAIIAMWV